MHNMTTVHIVAGSPTPSPTPIPTPSDILSLSLYPLLEETGLAVWEAVVLIADCAPPALEGRDEPWDVIIVVGTTLVLDVGFQESTIEAVVAGADEGEEIEVIVEGIVELTASAAGR